MSRLRSCATRSVRCSRSCGRCHDRRWFDESDVFAPIEVRCLGFVPAAGPIISGIDARLGWGIAYEVNSAMNSAIVTFDADLETAGIGRAFNLPAPQLGLHPLFVLRAFGTSARS